MKGMGQKMKTKALPAIIMLLGGFIACLAGIRAHMEVTDFMKMLFWVLIIFLVIGCLVKAVIDHFFAETQEEETTDGEEAGEDDENREAEALAEAEADAEQEKEE